MKAYRFSSRLLGILLCLSYCLVIPGLAQAEFDAQNELPDIGSSSDTVLSIQEERRLGEMFMRNVQRSAEIVDDPEVELYIQGLGQRLVSYLPSIPYDFHFFVIDAAEINAFAVPGGYVGINSGLILAAETENELASVVAHEIAHVSQRHISRSFEKNQRVSLTTMASIIAAILLSGQGGDASLAALSTGMATGYQAQLNFTRAHEKEADRVGIQLMAESGYDPRGMPQFFEKLQQQSRYSTTGLPEILMTHPVTVSRISDSTNRAEQYPKRGNVDHISFQLIKQKFKVNSAKNIRQTLKEYADLTQKNPSSPQLYGYALALTQALEFSQAEAILQKLIEREGERSEFLLALAACQAEQAGDAKKAAAKTYETALKIYPNHKAVVMAYGDYLLKSGHEPKARSLLEDYMRQTAPTANVYELRARIEDRLGNQAESHAAMAEAYFLTGMTGNAIEQLEFALKKLGENPFRRPGLEKRLEELKQIALQDKKEQ
ncbi:MAG: M48 family metalloprotease [Pseudomonadota bacterium]